MLTLKNLTDHSYEYLEQEIDNLVVEDLRPKELTRLGSVITDIVRLCDKFKYHRTEKLRWKQLNAKAREKLLTIIKFYDIIDSRDKDNFELANQLRVLSKISDLYYEELLASGYKSESIVDDKDTADAILGT